MLSTHAMQMEMLRWRHIADDQLYSYRKEQRGRRIEEHRAASLAASRRRQALIMAANDDWQERLRGELYVATQP